MSAHDGEQMPEQQGGNGQKRGDNQFHGVYSCVSKGARSLRILARRSLNWRTLSFFFG